MADNANDNIKKVVNDIYDAEHDFSIVLLQKTPLIKKAEYVIPEKENIREVMPIQLISKKDLA